MSVKQICPFTNQDCKAICNLWNTQFNQCSFYLNAVAEHRASVEITAKINNLTVAVNELAKKLDSGNGLVGSKLVEAVLNSSERTGKTSYTNHGNNSAYKPEAKDIIDEFHASVLDDESWTKLINTKTKNLYEEFSKWCKSKGFDPIPDQSMLTRSVLRRFGKNLTNDNKNGGTYRILT